MFLERANTHSFIPASSAVEFHTKKLSLIVTEGHDHVRPLDRIACNHEIDDAYQYNHEPILYRCIAVEMLSIKDLAQIRIFVCWLLPRGNKGGGSPTTNTPISQVGESEY